MESVLVPIECPRCGASFEPNGYQTYCSRKCQKNSARATARAEHVVEFIGVDGEGQTVDGKHEYVILSVGDVTLHNNGKPLTWKEIFPFLWEEFESHPDAVFVGYYLGYDFTQWLKGLPEHRARSLITKEGKAKRERRESGDNRTPFPVHYGMWSFDILGMKRFKLKPRGSKRWMYICDSGPFYQSSFVTAIDPGQWKDNPVCSPDEYLTIVEGKANRSAATFGPEMIRYNLVENTVLSRLMERLNEGFTQSGIKLNKQQWMGPGQASQKWMANIGCPSGNEIRDVVPEWARDAGRATYFGGWFEIFAHGIIPGLTYGYDINSAYPYVISGLPCLMHGEWTQGTGHFNGDLSYHMVKAHVKGTNPICGAMLHRDTHGRISRPNESVGWYWWSELAKAKDAGVIDTIEVFEWVNYKACVCPPPLKEIANLYEERLKVGKNSPQGKALKLVYNSAYGKLAQSVGHPRFSNSIWASLITSGCRTLILDAIATHPRGTKDLLMVATDGIYFRTPHTNLDISPDALGKWDEETKSNLTLFMPGMYWDDKTRQNVKMGKAPVLRSRGVNAKDLAEFIEQIDTLFSRWNPEQPWPQIDITVKFNMVSMGQALSRNKWESCGTVETDTTRTLDSNCASKREPWSVYQDGDIYRSYPYVYLSELESTPYDRRFGEELSELNEEHDTVDPDGEMEMLLAEALSSMSIVDVETMTY